MTATHDCPVVDRTQTPPIVHLAQPPYKRSRCGKPRGQEPLKPNAKVTCVVCLDLAGRSQ